MKFITGLFDLDLSGLVPEISTFMGTVKFLMGLSMLAGPLLLIVFGLLYMFKPAEHANFRFGYRTYFGMGSTEAWQYTQRIAGLVFTALGGVLFIAMIVVMCFFGKRELLQNVTTAAICLGVQAGALLIARMVIAIMVSVYFDGFGDRRR
jgi:uncharacterized membrane protein